MKIDFNTLQLEDIGMVPDFIWASPPCHTYSNMAGNYHRNPKQGEYEISEEAMIHNQFLLKLTFIVDFFKKKNPHLIVVLENPLAKLREMPLMEQMISKLNLHDVVVHYCAFGRGDKKPTMLWTNELSLVGKLSKFRCTKQRCPYYGQKHPIGVASHGHQYNAAAIPMALADEVSHYVDSKFYMNDINQTKQPRITDEEREHFNQTILGKESTSTASGTIPS